MQFPFHKKHPEFVNPLFSSIYSIFVRTTYSVYKHKRVTFACVYGAYMACKRYRLELASNSRLRRIQLALELHVFFSSVLASELHTLFVLFKKLNFQYRNIQKIGTRISFVFLYLQESCTICVQMVQFIESFLKVQIFCRLQIIGNKGFTDSRLLA